MFLMFFGPFFFFMYVWKCVQVLQHSSCCPLLYLILLNLVAWSFHLIECFFVLSMMHTVLLIVAANLSIES
jgi:hypothetical protein